MRGKEPISRKSPVRPGVIRLVVMMYVRYPLSLHSVEDLLFGRSIEICHETVRLWLNRFGPMFAREIRRMRVDRMRACTHWKWRLDEVSVKINAGRATSGAPSITRARRWNPSPQRHGTRLRPSNSSRKR